MHRAYDATQTGVHFKVSAVFCGVADMQCSKTGLPNGAGAAEYGAAMTMQASCLANASLKTMLKTSETLPGSASIRASTVS